METVALWKCDGAEHESHHAAGRRPERDENAKALCESFAVSRKVEVQVIQLCVKAGRHYNLFVPSAGRTAGLKAGRLAGLWSKKTRPTALAAEPSQRVPWAILMGIIPGAVAHHET